MQRQLAQIRIEDASKRKRKYRWGELVQTELGIFKVYACHAAQLDILASKAKFTFAFAGSGGGKTCLIPLWIFKQLQLLYAKGIKHPRILVISPTVSTFKSSELKRHILDTFEGTAYGSSTAWHDGSKTYELPTGGEIIVKTVGDGGDWQRLTGGQYHAAVLDECYLLSADVWEETRRRVSNNDGSILAVTTPTGNNWIYDAKQKADQGDVDYYVRHWAKTANPTVSKEDVEREKGLQSDARYRRMVLGEFSALDGLAYECFSDDKAASYPIIQGDPTKGLPSPPIRFFGGYDWGFTDPSAAILFAECENDITYAVDEIYKGGCDVNELAAEARKMVDKWSVRVDSKYADLGGTFKGFYCDSSRPENIKAFRSVGIPIRKKRIDDIMARIAVTDSWLRSGKVKIYSTCPNLIRELRGYQFAKDRQGGVKEKPIGKNDHACDSFSYAISSHKYGQRPNPIDLTPSTDEDDLAKLERYGKDPLANEAKLKELEEKRANERFYEMAFGDLDD